MASPAPAPPRVTRRFLWLLAAIGAVAVAVRFGAMVGRELWLDEANTVLLTLREHGLVESLRQDSSPPLYYALLKLWIGAFGTGEYAVRLPSVLAGAAAVVAVGRLAARSFSTRAGVLAAALLAVAPAHVEYSTEVRQYALGGLLVVLAAASIAAWTRRPTHRGAILAGALLAACLYTHYFTLFIAAAALPVAIWCAPGRARWSGAWMAVVPGVAFAFWVPVLLVQLDRSSGFLFWLERFWERDGPVGALRIWAGAWWFGDPFVQSLPGNSLLGWTALALLAAAAAGTLRFCLEERARLVLWSACFGSVLAVWAYSLVVSPPVFIPGRLDQLVYPTFVMLLGGALDRLPGKMRWAAASVAMAALLGGTVWSFTGGTTEAGARQLARDLGRGGREDAVVCGLLSRAPVEYYLLGKGWNVYSFPSAYAGHLGNHDPREFERIDLPADAAELSATLVREGRERIVVVLPLFAARVLSEPLFAALRGAGYVPDRDRGRYHPRRGDELAVVEFHRAGAPAE